MNSVSSLSGGDYHSYDKVPFGYYIDSNNKKAYKASPEDVSLFKAPIEVIEHRAFYPEIARMFTKMNSQEGVEFINKILPHCRYKQANLYYLLRPSKSGSQNPDVQVFSLSFLRFRSHIEHFRLAYNMNTKEWLVFAGNTSVSKEKTLDTLIQEILKDYRSEHNIKPADGLYSDKEEFEKIVINAVLNRDKSEALLKEKREENDRVRKEGIRLAETKEFNSIHQLALKGIAESQETLARYFNEGFGCEKDENEGLKWRKMAASQGYDTSILNLGLYYEKKGGIEDLREAQSYFSSLEKSQFAKHKISEISKKLQSFDKSL